ncbi:hypothetical protein M5K25_000204 [Dendrobium thyrsiflorum]|uniref:Uncharacterized protein n=1 Tax=Dendrobium thyrsiflorum TaxID=117978 RepID=A0ABD0VT06_DENTH
MGSLSTTTSFYPTMRGRLHESFFSIVPSSLGSIEVAELDWGNEDHIRAVCPPFDYIIGTDIVYAEHLLEPLVQTIMALSGPRTTIMLGYEIRSTTVHEQMIQTWKDNFVMKTVPKAKMDIKYQHPSIQLFIMELKPPLKLEGNLQNTNAPLLNSGNHNCEIEDDLAEKEGVELIAPVEDMKAGDWESRRHGALAARLLKDVKIS